MQTRSRGKKINVDELDSEESESDNASGGESESDNASGGESESDNASGGESESDNASGSESSSDEEEKEEEEEVVVATLSTGVPAAPRIQPINPLFINNRVLVIPTPKTKKLITGTVADIKPYSIPEYNNIFKNLMLQSGFPEENTCNVFFFHVANVGYMFLIDYYYLKKNDKSLFKPKFGSVKYLKSCERSAYKPNDSLKYFRVEFNLKDIVYATAELQACCFQGMSLDAKVVNFIVKAGFDDNFDELLVTQLQHLLKCFTENDDCIVNVYARPEAYGILDLPDQFSPVIKGISYVVCDVISGVLYYSEYYMFDQCFNDEEFKKRLGSKECLIRNIGVLNYVTLAKEEEKFYKTEVGKIADKLLKRSKDYHQRKAKEEAEYIETLQTRVGEKTEQSSIDEQADNVKKTTNSLRTRKEQAKLQQNEVKNQLTENSIQDIKTKTDQMKSKLTRITDTISAYFGYSPNKGDTQDTAIPVSSQSSKDIFYDVENATGLFAGAAQFYYNALYAYPVNIYNTAIRSSRKAATPEQQAVKSTENKKKKKKKKSGQDDTPNKVKRTKNKKR